VRIPDGDKDWAAWVSEVWIASHAVFFVMYAVVTGFDRHASLQPMPMGHKIYFLCASVFALVVATKAKQDTERRKRRRTRLIDFAIIWAIFAFLGLILLGPALVH
jgi:hypothetical protein